MAALWSCRALPCKPSGRVAQPETVAKVVVELMEGTAPFETGAMVFTDHEIIGRLSDPALL